MFIEKLSDEQTLEFLVKYPAYTFWFEGSNELEIVGYYLIDRDEGLELGDKKLLLLMGHIKDQIVYIGDGVTNYIGDITYNQFRNIQSGLCHIAFSGREFYIYNS